MFAQECIGVRMLLWTMLSSQLHHFISPSVCNIFDSTLFILVENAQHLIGERVVFIGLLGNMGILGHLGDLDIRGLLPHLGLLYILGL